MDLSLNLMTIAGDIFQQVTHTHTYAIRYSICKCCILYANGIMALQRTDMGGGCGDRMIRAEQSWFDEYPFCVMLLKLSKIPMADFFFQFIVCIQKKTDSSCTKIKTIFSVLFWCQSSEGFASLIWTSQQQNHTFSRKIRARTYQRIKVNALCAP